MTLLEITDLETHYHTKEGTVQAVEGINLDIEENQIFGLIGESGCGKSTVAKSIMRVLPDNATVDGSISFNGTNLLDISEKEMQDVRWNNISIIPQSSMNSLDPVYSVGSQIIDVIQRHRDVSKREARERTVELFNLVNLDPDRMGEYPHQFSGGMQQRVMIAASLALEPELIVADEPTTALDVIIQRRILQNIQQIIEDINSSMLIITHDISVVSEICDIIAVMYRGNIVELGPTREIIKNPQHPYTMGLRNAFPSVLERSKEILSIPGAPKKMINPADDCRFIDRCPFAVDECYENKPELLETEPGHLSRCFRSDESVQLEQQARNRETWREQ